MKDTTNLTAIVLFEKSSSPLSLMLRSFNSLPEVRIGVSRFRQRWFCEDHILHDEEVMELHFLQEKACHEEWSKAHQAEFIRYISVVDGSKLNSPADYFDYSL